MKKVIIYYITKWVRFYRKIKIVVKFPNATFSNHCVLNIQSVDKFMIGDRSSVGDYSVLIVADDYRNKINPANSKLLIGRNTYIGELNNIRAAGGTISIGDNCMISQHVTIVCSNHGIDFGTEIVFQNWSLDKNFVVIEDDVWIGANSVILPGVTIQHGAIVAAGSVVTKDVPSYTIVKGNPAQFLRMR